MVEGQNPGKQPQIKLLEHQDLTLFTVEKCQFEEKLRENAAK